MWSERREDMVDVYIAEIETEIVGLEIKTREIDVVLKLTRSDVRDIVNLFEHLENKTSFKWKKAK